MTVSLIKISPATVVYTVGANIPGYLPESDVAVFADVESARIYLADELDQLADYLADVESDGDGDDTESLSASVAGSVGYVKSDPDRDIAWSIQRHGGWTTYEETGRSLPTAYWIHASTLGEAFGDDTDSDEYLDVVDAILGR